MKKSKLIAVAAAAAGLVTAFGAGPAMADPTAPTNTALVAVGSDTTQDLMQGLSDLPTMTRADGTRPIDSWHATGSASITTKTNNANCAFTRPVGSGAGATALSDAILNANYGGSAGPIKGCVQIARSSSGNGSGLLPAGTSITMIPFATDTVTYGTRIGSTVSKQLTTAQLKTYYEMAVTDPKCMANPSHQALGYVQPLLPQAGSGTRSFFLSAIGVTTVGTCVKDTNADGSAIIENTGGPLSDTHMLIPFSVGQWKSQRAGVVNDTTGQAMLNAVGGTFAAGYDREVYNGVPTSVITSGSADYDQDVVNGFVGPTSKICSTPSTITKYGFGVDANCGATSRQVQ